MRMKFADVADYDYFYEKSIFEKQAEKTHNRLMRIQQFQQILFFAENFKQFLRYVKSRR